MNMRKKKFRCGYLPAQLPGMSTILLKLLLMLFCFLMPTGAQACCYDCVSGGNFSWICCSTAEECTAPAEAAGCTIEPGNDYAFGGTLYWRHCSGASSICSVLSNINCCAFGGTKCCIGNPPKTDPCCDNPDPCCKSKDPKCCKDPESCECKDKYNKNSSGGE
jgi:hypothetical protein